jgi:cell division protein FtsN
MKNNERGGIISKLIIIPVGVALMAGFFFLGYYVGKYRSAPENKAEVVQPLPDVPTQDVPPQETPKQEEFTFYKTLTDKGDRTVSIDLRPKPSNSGSASEKKQTEPEALKSIPVPRPDADKDRSPEIKADKGATPAPKEAVAAKATAPVVKERAASGLKLRYTLQVASYQDKQAAEDDVKKLKREGYAAFIVSSLLPEKGTWYRVRLGSFTTKAAAEKLQKELHAKAGISPIVVIE